MAVTPGALRLLFFTREDFPSERVDIEVLFGRELVRRGHAIDLVAQASSTAVAAGRQPWHGRVAYVGRTVGRPGFAGKALKQLRGFGHDLWALGLARPKDYDAIQVRDKFLIAVCGILVARVRGLKFFFWLSFPMPQGDLMHARSGNARFPAVTWLRGQFTGWLLDRWIVPLSDHIFVQSERLKGELCARGGNPVKLTPVPMGVALVGAAAPRESRRRPGVETTLGYLGTLDANRHLAMLIGMLRDLRDSGMVVKLLLIGDANDPRDREALERQAAVCGVADHLEITGMLPHALALERIRGATIGLSPIYPSPIFLVGSPTKLVEYMALGLPVIANSHPEQRAILKASGAGVCVPWGGRYFARAARWLLRHSAEQLNTMGEKGRGWVGENRSYAKIADNLEGAYLRLLSDNASGNRQ